MNESLITAAEEAVIAGDDVTLSRLLQEHPFLTKTKAVSERCGSRALNYSGDSARSIIVREHQFPNWDAYAAHRALCQNTNSRTAQFESAADAIVTGSLAKLESCLRSTPEIIYDRSTRLHHSTLLHYIGANGIESWRQRTPKNAVTIAKTLLDAGARVDTMADLYDGSTPLGLVATSIHPFEAGIQNDLIDLFLKYGAQMDSPVAAGNQQNIVNGCLSNGRPTAAAHLATRGAKLDLEGAAGVGDLAKVQQYFDPQGFLRDTATTAQLHSGFHWACQYGFDPVVEFLLSIPLEFDQIHRGQTGLHWAAYGGHLRIVQRLLSRGSSTKIRDTLWNNTPLAWALYGWENPPAKVPGDYEGIIALLLAHGAEISESQRANHRIQNSPRIQSQLRCR